jgi:hypothetical protein
MNVCSTVCLLIAGRLQSTFPNFDGMWRVRQGDGAIYCIAIRDGYVKRLWDGCEQPIRVLASNPVEIVGDTILISFLGELPAAAVSSQRIGFTLTQQPDGSLTGRAVYTCPTAPGKAEHDVILTRVRQ